MPSTDLQLLPICFHVFFQCFRKCSQNLNPDLKTLDLRSQDLRPFFKPVGYLESCETSKIEPYVKIDNY